MSNTESKRQDFEYRQLENDLVYLTESIIKKIGTEKIALICWSEDGIDTSCFECAITANMEKAYVTLYASSVQYNISVWEKDPSFFSDQPLEINSDTEEAVKEHGKLVLDYSDISIDFEDQVRIKPFNPDILTLITNTIGEITNAYLSRGSVSSEIKNLFD